MKVVCNDAGGCAGLEIPAHLRPPEDFGNEADPRLAPLEQLKAELEKKNEE